MIDPRNLDDETEAEVWRGRVNALILAVDNERDAANPKSVEACAAELAQEYGVSAREFINRYDAYLRGELDDD